MIQELLGVVEERKMSIPESLLLNGGSSPASFPSSSPVFSSSQSSLSSSSEPQQNLRCPRCDSSNTKFCYYNNYNLTQPRHFCKTCRRYWTKGGALRNVPIGGGCRKARPSLATASVRPGRYGPASPDVVMARLDQEHMLPPSTPIAWATPYSSHSQLLALLRANQVQNTNPNPSPIPNLNSIRMKEEGALFGSHIVGEANGGLKEHGLGLDPLGPLWRNGNGQYAYQHQQLQQQHNMVIGDVQSSGIQELLQRLRSSVNCHHNDQFPALMSNVGSSAAVTTAAMAASGTTASLMEPVPLTGGDFGYWNPGMSWADVPPTNGAFL